MVWNRLANQKIRKFFEYEIIVKYIKICCDKILRITRGLVII